MSFALSVYHRLPSGPRSLVASLRGYYLNWWRYDKQTEKLVDKFLEREMWSERHWADWRSERLGYMLERAATRVPYYREQWADRRRRGDRASWSYLENWPILEKESLRNDALGFVADDCRPATMFHDHTSGTTGTSLDLWLSKATVKEWYALFEARSRNWYGLSRRDRWAMIGGQLVTPVGQKKPPFWVWNAGLNQLYLSSYHLAPDLIPAYIDALSRYRVKYILGYPSAIYSLAIESLSRNRSCPRMEVVITNAEPLFEYQRSAISEAFSCPVRETYGMAEIVAAAGECDHGSLHQWPEAGIIEWDTAMQAKTHDLICTGFFNADMPLIRYKVGDSGSLASGSCACGRSLPVIEQIEGRSDDMLYTLDGKRVGRMDPVFKGDLSIREAQIIQESLSTIKIRYVPDERFSTGVFSKLTERICHRLGNVSVVFEEVSEIPRTKRGKFQAVVCQLSIQQRMAIENVTNQKKNGSLSCRK
jgi:phenylacetate-CoA ligase